VDERARRGLTLVAIAREAIARELEPHEATAWEEDWLRAPGASFVTLRLAGALRGCIGSVDAHRALGNDVAQNARAAAYRDPRFPPLPALERSELQVEISVLSAREPLNAASEEEALKGLRRGIDGVVLEFEDLRATFLPQVWEGLPSPMDFLCELRRKADLPARFWHPNVRLSRYTVEKYP